LEVKAFKKLLQAFYGESYPLNGVPELKRMTRIADYYCALPVLSRSISLPLSRGDFSIECKSSLSSIELIEIATKLHHRDLFRECVIWLAGSWSRCDPDLSKLNRKVQRIIRNARNGIYALVAKVHREVRLLEEILFFSLLNQKKLNCLTAFRYDQRGRGSCLSDCKG